LEWPTSSAWQYTGVPWVLANQIAELPFLAAAMDSILIADRTGRTATEVAATYFATGVGLHIDRLAAAARAMPIADHFDRLALDRAVDAMGAAQRRITAETMRDGDHGEAAFKAWMDARRAEVDRVRMAINEITSSSGLTVSQLTVAASMLGDLARMALADEMRELSVVPINF
jgi:glutamate dehydrogenase